MLIGVDRVVGVAGRHLRHHIVPVLLWNHRDETGGQHFLAGVAKIAAIGLINEGQGAVGQESAHQLGLILDNGSVASLAKPQQLIGLPALGDVGDEAFQRCQLALVVKHATALFRHPAFFALVGNDAVAELERFASRQGILYLLPYRFPISGMNDLAVGDAAAGDQIVRRIAG